MSLKAAPLSTFYPTLGLIATLGDSRLAQGFTVSGAFTNKRPLGACWLEAMMGGRVRLSSAYNCAVSGATFADVATTQMVTLLGLNPRPSHAVILAGTNDISTGAAQATIKANILSTWAALKAAKIQPVHVCDLPRTNASWTTANQQASQELNEWLREYGPRNGVAVVDPTPLIADIANSNGDPLSGYYQSDGIHPAMIGAYQINVALAQYFNTIPLPGYARPGSLADAYNSTYNTRGNLLPNAGLFTGTGGTNLGTGASGTVSTGWTNRVVSGTMTAVASQVARADAGAVGNWQQVVLSVTSAGVYRFSPTSTISGQAVGDQVYGEIDIQWSSATSLQYIQLSVFDVGGASAAGSIAFKDTGLSTLYLPASSGGTLRLITDPFTLTTGNTDVAFRLEASCANSGGATILAGGAALRKYIAQ